MVRKNKNQSLLIIFSLSELSEPFFIINKKTYDLKNAKKNRMEVTTRKMTKSEAKEMYNELTQKDIDTPETREKKK